VTILANACGAAVGGLAFPYLFEVSGYGILFLLGGGAMFLGALVSLPRTYCIKRSR
jgi:predicted MFS family arabinose efflux permease